MTQESTSKSNGNRDGKSTSSSAENSALHQVLVGFIHAQHLPESYMQVALKWFVPLCDKINLHHNNANKPVIIGINGCQGSGKSTLSALLVELLVAKHKKKVISFSLDDFYLSKKAREELGKRVHPLLSTRGVPGTHDHQMLNQSLHSLLNKQETLIPAFDKSQDDLFSKDNWQHVSQAQDIIIFEGWCVGTQAQDEALLDNPINNLEKTLDPDAKWRKFVNDKLKHEYQEIFAKIDYLVMLKAPSFEQVYGWRCEQERRLKQKLTAQNKGKLASESGSKLMTDEEIHEFIQFYQRLTEHTLTSMPAKCDSLYILNSTRSIEACQHL